MINTANLQAIFYYIAVFATLLFLIKTVIFSLTGGDSEVFADFNTEFETETSFDFLSIQSILAFFMGLGWAGLAATKQFHLSLWLSIIIAVAFGLLLLFMSAYLMFLVKKLNKRVVMNYDACVGQIAKAYTAFHPEGEGQIEIKVNNKLTIEKAKSISKEEIKAFSEVKIVEYKDKLLYIDINN